MASSGVVYTGLWVNKLIFGDNYLSFDQFVGIYTIYHLFLLSTDRGQLELPKPFFTVEYLKMWINFVVALCTFSTAF